MHSNRSEGLEEERLRPRSFLGDGGATEGRTLPNDVSNGFGMRLDGLRH